MSKSKLRLKRIISFCLLYGLSLAVHAQTLTYYDNIKSIVEKKCIECHQEKRIAPFRLDSYEQVIKYKNKIVSVIENDYMPPWKADTSYSHFLNERILSSTEKLQIINWINEGCKEGRDDNPPIFFTRSVGPQVFADITFCLPVALEVKAGKRDTIINLEINYALPRDTFVGAYQFLPGINSGIKHAWFHILDTERPVDNISPETMLTGDFWDGSKFNHRSYSSKHLAIDGEWLPGQLAVAMPSGTGFILPKKGVIIYRVQYGPSPVSYTSNFEVQITYAKEITERIPVEFKFGSGTKSSEIYPPLVIPPDTVTSYSLEATIPYKCSMISITPHMNSLGKSFKSWIVKTNGDTLELINIKDWDVAWQGHYYPPTLIVLEKDDRVQAEIQMDNTSANTHNPNHPPKFVRYGTATSDETIQLFIQAIPYKTGDESLTIKPGKVVF